MTYGEFTVTARNDKPTAHPERLASRRADEVGFGGAEAARAHESAIHRDFVVATVGRMAREQAFEQAAKEQEAMAAHEQGDLVHH